MEADLRRRLCWRRRAGGGSAFAGGGSRAAPAFYGGGFRAAPVFRGAYFTGRSVGRPSVAPRFYYGGNRMSAVRPQGFTRSVGRSTRPYVGRSAAATRQPNRVNSIAATEPRYRSADFDRDKSSAKSRRLQVQAEIGFRIRGPRPQLTDRLRQTVSRSSETMHPSVMMGTGTATGTGIIHISTTIRSLSSSMASGGAWIPGSIRTTLMTIIHADDYGYNPYDYSYG